MGPPDDATAGEAEHAGAASAGPALLRRPVDFHRLRHDPHGQESITVDLVDAPALAGLELREGMQAVFEEPGELQMTGTLRRRRVEATGRECWEGELNPHSLVYHICLAPRTLYDAGPEGCARYVSWTPGRLPDPREPRLEPSAQGGGEAPKPSGPPTIANHTMRLPTPWRLLTLGVEGTWEQWDRALAFDTLQGEAAFADGAPAVLVDDARVQVWCLPPDVDYPSGRRIWVAEPAWSTVRRAWPERPAHR